MKVCFAANGNDLSSRVDFRFGRCPWFIFLDDEKEKDFQAVENPGANAFRGAGVVAAQLVVEKKVRAVVTGNIGPNALVIFQPEGIKVYQGGGIKVAEAWEKFKKGELEEIVSPQRRGGWRGR